MSINKLGNKTVQATKSTGIKKPASTEEKKEINAIGAPPAPPVNKSTGFEKIGESARNIFNLGGIAEKVGLKEEDLSMGSLLAGAGDAFGSLKTGMELSQIKDPQKLVDRLSQDDMINKIAKDEGRDPDQIRSALKGFSNYLKAKEAGKRAGMKDSIATNLLLKGMGFDGWKALGEDVPEKERFNGPNLVRKQIEKMMKSKEKSDE